MVKPDDEEARNAGAHFAQSDFFEDSRNVDPEEYYSFVKQHLYSMHDEKFDPLVEKLGGDFREAAHLISDEMAKMMRQYKDYIDADIGELDEVRLAARNADEAARELGAGARAAEEAARDAEEAAREQGAAARDAEEAARELRAAALSAEEK